MNWHGHDIPDPDWVSPCEQAVLYCADCLDILPKLPSGCVDAVVTDPPYGIDYKPLRGSNGSKMWGQETVRGDSVQFDPNPILSLSLPTIMWGANHFADALPRSGGWLVWDKTKDGIRDGFIYSHCELAWTNTQTRIHKFDLNWQGNSRDGDPFLHPTQKSERLMEWCVKFVDGDILDPFTGSGTTGVACARLGRRFIGIEIEPKYFEIAKTRIDQELRQLKLFTEATA